jgi:hypothetical protein
MGPLEVAVGCQLSAVSRQLSAISCQRQLSAVSYQLSAELVGSTEEQ